MLSIPEIVDCLRVSRDEFKTFFLQGQVNNSISVENRKTFDAVIGGEADDKQAFIIALTYAQAENWLDVLLDIIIYEGRENGKLTKHFAETFSANSQNSDLQGMIDIARGLAQPDVFFKGWGNAMRWTGKIFVKGNFKGTGILIKPHLLLTVWHVIEPLFAPKSGGVYEQKPISSGDLEVVFDDFLQLIQRGQSLRPVNTLRISAYSGNDNSDDERKKWCVYFSPCHPDELLNRKPDPLEGLDGYWDYVIIRLAKAPGLERRWAFFDSRALVPKDKDDIVVFQHPAGQPLKFDRGPITNLKPPKPTVIPKIRFLHLVNTVGGSSGGPCFDKSFSLFGLHQGEWSNKKNGKAQNRGIPIVRVAEHLNLNQIELPDLDPSENFIWRLGDNQVKAPVIGTDDFQTLIWESALKGTPKIITISGDKGRGKTFRIEVLKAILPESGHLKIHLNSQIIAKYSARELAVKICEASGAEIPQFEELGEINSTSAVWLKNELIPKVISALNAVKSDRLVWLIISDLNLFEIEGDLASEFLLNFYEQLLQVQWLRIVLDGMSGDIPATLNNVLDRHIAAQITSDDIKVYLNRFLTDAYINVDAAGLGAFVNVASDGYAQNVSKEPVLSFVNLLSMLKIYCNYLLANS